MTTDAKPETKADAKPAKAADDNPNDFVVGVNVSVPDTTGGGPESDLRFSKTESDKGSVLDGAKKGDVTTAFVE